MLLSWQMYVWVCFSHTQQWLQSLTEVSRFWVPWMSSSACLIAFSAAIWAFSASSRASLTISAVTLTSVALLLSKKNRVIRVNKKKVLGLLLKTSFPEVMQETPTGHSVRNVTDQRKDYSMLDTQIPGTVEPGGLPSMGSQSRTQLKWLRRRRKRYTKWAPLNGI